MSSLLPWLGHLLEHWGNNCGNIQAGSDELVHLTPVHVLGYLDFELPLKNERKTLKSTLCNQNFNSKVT